MDGRGTGTIGFGVLDSDGSGILDGKVDGRVADEAGSAEATDTDVFADGATGSLEGNSVRLRLAVALAGIFGSPSVVSGN